MNLRQLSTLQIAIGISVVVHAALFLVRIVDPEGFNRVFQDTPLEVILVNAKTNERPEKAKAIAQASLAGGGDAQKGRATSPLPPSAFTQMGDAAEDSQRQQEQQLLQEQAMLLTQLTREVKAMESPQFRQVSEVERATFEEKRRQRLKLLAEIEKRITEENERPRKRYISPSTREEAYAIYYDHLRTRIEDKGTRNFPEASGKKIYGQLVMQIAIDFEGQVVDTIVEQSSGNSLLDRRAQQIARTAGPFGKVPASAQASLLKSGYNRLAFVALFNFSSDLTLETTLRAR